MVQREPGEWMPPGHKGERVDGGKVSQTDRWWPLRWWRGHWLSHRSCGQWRDDGGPYVCTLHHDHDGGHDFTPAPHSLLYGRATQGRKLTAAERDAADYKAYLEARYAQAEHATRGVMVNPSGQRRGVKGSQWFGGRRPSDRYASEELQDWLRSHGRTLTASEYHSQHREREPVYPEVP